MTWGSVKNSTQLWLMFGSWGSFNVTLGLGAPPTEILMNWPGVGPGLLFVLTLPVIQKKSRVGTAGPQPSPRPSSLLSRVGAWVPRCRLPCNSREGRLSSVGYSHKRLPIILLEVHQWRGHKSFQHEEISCHLAGCLCSSSSTPFLAPVSFFLQDNTRRSPSFLLNS